jgi:threonine/homoserine/homoserine lactone efflux protein
MGTAIGDVLGTAVGVAISPVPIIALILMLFSRAATRNGVSFLAGWLVGLVGVGLVVLAVGLEASDEGESDSSGVLKIIIGALFVLLGWRQWKGRPRGGEEPAMPGWMTAIDDFSSAKSFGMGILLTVLNPKNLGLTVAAAATIGSAGLSGGEEAVTLLLFVAIASLTIAAPIALYLLVRERAETMLDAMKEWLVANNNTVMTVLFVVLGAKVLGDGIAILA